jgi:ERCC4-type nuclease
MIIKVDSREQLPLDFTVTGNVTQVLTIGLPFGDYWATMQDKQGNEIQDIPVVFERKSIEDLYSTLTHGHDRFKRELERAEQMDCKMYLIIEGSLSETLSGVGYSKVEPDSLVKSLFTFKVKYGLEPIFCNNRSEIKRYILETWEAFGRNFKH